MPLPRLTPRFFLTAVLLVACAPTDEPVFLRHDDKEDFYVRVGPSSRRLPTSSVLDWIEERAR